MELILKVLNAKFKKYKIIDASNLNRINFIKVSIEHMKNDNVIIYINKNLMNTWYFDLCEKNGENIKHALINKSNVIYFFRDDNKVVDVVNRIKLNLLQNNSCWCCGVEQTNINEMKFLLCDGGCFKSLCFDCMIKNNNKCECGKILPLPSIDYKSEDILLSMVNSVLGK